MVFICWYISLYMCHTFITSSVRKILQTRLKTGTHPGKQDMAVPRLVNDEENYCKFEVQRNEYWIHTDLLVNCCQGMVAGVIFD